MSEIINNIRVEHKAIFQVINLLEQQLLEFSKGDSPDFELMIDSIDFLKSYLDLETRSGEKLLFIKLVEKENQAHSSIPLAIKEIDTYYITLEESINEFSITIDKVVLGAFIPRSYVNEQAKVFINDFREYIKLKDSVLDPVTPYSLHKQDWTEIEEFANNENEQLNPDSLTQYRSTLYQSTVRN